MGCCVSCCGGQMPPTPDYIGLWISDDNKATLELTANGRVEYRLNSGEHVSGAVVRWYEKNTQDGGYTFEVACCTTCSCCLSKTSFDVSKKPEYSAGQFQRQGTGAFTAAMRWRCVINGYRF